MIKSFKFLAPIVVFTIAWTAMPNAEAQALRRGFTSLARAGMCLCPYDRVVTAGTLYLPTQIYQCGDVSAYVRTGGREPSCYMSDMLNGGDISDYLDQTMACMSMIGICKTY